MTFSVIVNAGCGRTHPTLLLSLVGGQRQGKGAHEMLMTCQDCRLHFQASSCQAAAYLLPEPEQISTRLGKNIIINLNLNFIHDNSFKLALVQV